MGKLRDLNESLLQATFEQQKSAAERCTSRWEAADELHQIIKNHDQVSGYRYSRLNRALYVREQVRAAELTWPMTENVEQTQSAFQQAAIAWLPAMEAMEFGKTVTTQYAVHKSRVKDAVEQGKARILEQPKDPRGYVLVEQESMSAELEPMPTEEALYAAVISGDWGLAERMAQTYQLHSFNPQDRPANNIRAILRDLLVNDDQAVRRRLNHFSHSYSKDRASPYCREELMFGIVNGDEDMIREGLLKTNARFKTVWNLKSYEKRQHLKRAGSVEAFHAECFRDLLIFRWSISIFAVAMMRIAARRGLVSLHKESKCWSDWVPRALAVA